MPSQTAVLLVESPGDLFLSPLVAQLVMLLLLLALLSFHDYVVSTWGPWLIAITLLIAPFWFNPQTFSLSKTTVRPRYPR